MISVETVARLTQSYRTTELNVVREYAQHVFLAALYANPKSEGLLFKGGTALRIVYRSPRFSEDLDFSSYGMSVGDIEALFLETLAELEKQGFTISLHERSHETSGGYYGEATMDLFGNRVTLEINVNMRKGTQQGEYRLISGDFAPSYGLLMLPERMLVSEKIQALQTRQKPRDFYDLYFMLRAQMISVDVRAELREAVSVIERTSVDFRRELGVFLPTDSQSLIRDFKKTLLDEVRRNINV